MKYLHPYINFNGSCLDAINYYKDCMQATASYQLIKDSSLAIHCPETIHNHVMHATLSKDNQVILMGSDLNGPGGYAIGNNISICINCSSEEEIDHLFESFAAEGEVLDKLKVQFGGSMFAAVRDKFTIVWLLNYEVAEVN